MEFRYTLQQKLDFWTVEGSALRDKTLTGASK